jgi:hypothetical protein
LEKGAAKETIDKDGENMKEETSSELRGTGTEPTVTEERTATT